MGKRQESRDRIERRIVELGRRHLATEGAAGLSLRAIARDLDMVSSAVYRYVASRDDLLTLLLVDAYTELADTVESARDGTSDSWQAQLASMARAARLWAVAAAGLLGTAVRQPGARLSRTPRPDGRAGHPRCRRVVLGGGDGCRRGRRHAVGNRCHQPLSTDFDGLRAEFDFDADDTAIAKCLVLWAALVGAISLEVFGQYGSDTFTDPAATFETQVALLTDMLDRPRVRPGELEHVLASARCWRYPR